MHAPLIVTETKLLSMLFYKAFYNDQVLTSLFHLEGCCLSTMGQY